LLRRKIFEQSQVKTKFYNVAKKATTETGTIEGDAMCDFYQTCQQGKVAACPIFSKIHDGRCSLIGYYINKETAVAFAKMLETLSSSKDFCFEELNLDYNGLKDDQFAVLLHAL
jgi:hypothetical protein